MPCIDLWFAKLGQGLTLKLDSKLSKAASCDFGGLNCSCAVGGTLSKGMESRNEISPIPSTASQIALAV